MKIQLKRVLAGISCASLILSEVALIDIHAYAVDSGLTVGTELTEENADIQDNARQEENEEQVGVEEATGELDDTVEESKEEVGGEADWNESDNPTGNEDR